MQDQPAGGPLRILVRTPYCRRVMHRHSAHSTYDALSSLPLVAVGPALRQLLVVTPSVVRHGPRSSSSLSSSLLSLPRWLRLRSFWSDTSASQMLALSLVVGLAGHDQHRAEEPLLEEDPSRLRQLRFHVLALLGVFLSHPHNVQVRGGWGTCKPTTQ